MNSWATINGKYGPAVMANYYDPFCRCNVNQPFCTFNHRTILPKLSSSLLSYLQKFVSIRNNLSSSYETKISELLSVWKGCVVILNEHTLSGSHIFMHFAVSESAFLILPSEWKNINNEIKNEFDLVLNQVRDKLKMLKSHIESINNCDCLMSLIKSPWEDHNCLYKLIEGEPTKEEVAKFMQFEKSSIYALRLKILCENNNEKLAYKLSSLAMALYNENRFVATYYCDYQDLMFIREIYYACLKMFDKNELMTQLHFYNPQNGGKQLFQRCCSRMSSLLLISKENKPRICNFIMSFCHLATTILVCCTLNNVLFLDDVSELLHKWCFSMNGLIQSEFSCLKKRIHYVLEFSNSAVHCYLLGEILYAQLGSRLPLTMYIEIYTHALLKNINEKEAFIRSNNKDGAFNSLTMLVRGYLEFANILENVLSVCRECVLTAFYLMPSKDLMVKIKKLAEKSNKLPTCLSNVSKNSHGKSNESTSNLLQSVYSGAIWIKMHKQKWYSLESYFIMHSELIALSDPLSQSMEENLNFVLKYPRDFKFNWDLEWPELEKECMKLLENFDSVLKQNLLINSDLKFCHISARGYDDNKTMLNKGMACNETENVSDDNVDLVESIYVPENCVVFNRKHSKPTSRKRKSVTQKPPECDPLNRPKIISELELEELPIKRSLRSHISFDETEDSFVGSLFSEESLSANQNSNSETKNSSNDNSKLDDENAQNLKGSMKSSMQKILHKEKTFSINQGKELGYLGSNKDGMSSEKVGSLIGGNLENNTPCSTNASCGNMNVKCKNNNFNVLNDTNIRHPNFRDEHLSSLSAELSQLNTLDFFRPANVDNIINVVQIQTTTNPLTTVSQTQTEPSSNLHSRNEIEKKTNDNQSGANSLDNFASVYQPNSLNNNISSVQNSSIRQGECSFSENVSINNKKMTTNVHNSDQQEISKPIGTHDVLNQNQTSLEHHRYNDIQLKNSDEPTKPTVGNSMRLSSNVIIRTSDVSPSHATTGQITNTTKKLSYCVKTHDRFIDLTLPESISSTSTNSNRSSNILALMNSKIQSNSPIQTSVGLQVNFNNQPSESVHTISPNAQSSQVCTNSAENLTSINVPMLSDQIVKSANSRTSTSSNLSVVNSVSRAQTQTCIGLRSKEVSSPNVSVVSLMMNSTQSQIMKTSMPNSLYTTSQNQIVSLSDLSKLSHTNRSDEQKKIDHLKLISQTFTATSDSIQFVTSNTESQRLIQSTEKGSMSNLPVFQSLTDSVSIISQEHDSGSKLFNRGRGNTKTSESKTISLKETNMSDMFVFEKGTLYAVQDDVNQVESTKLVPSPRQFTTHVKIQNSQVKEIIERPKSSLNVSPNITITGSMLPRFQQVFGKTKFQSSTIINDNSSLGSTSLPSTSSNPGPVINRSLISSRVYSSSKGVQTNHDVDHINSKINCITPKVIDHKLQRNLSMVKSGIVMTVGNNKNNVIMTCKTASSLKSNPQVSASSSNQLLTCNIDSNNGVEKGTTSKVLTAFTTNCNNPTTSSNTNIIYSIPVQSDLKSISHVEKPLQNVTQIQKQFKMSPSIIQTVLRKYPNWQQNSFRQGKQSIEVQTTPNVERLIPVNVSNIVKTTIESSNNKVVSVSTGKPNVIETNVSPSMMEQMMEFESVLEEVRKTSLLNEMNSTSMLPQINHEIIQIHSPTENVDLLNTDSNQTLFPLNKKSSTNNERDRCSFSFLNQSLSNDLAGEEKEPVVVSSPVISVRSATPNLQTTSPNNNVTVNLVDGLTQCSKQAINKAKPVIKTPASSPSTSTVKVPVLQKPLPKLQEDEQTTQRIYAILDKYAEQLRNSPELKNKPAPRRRTNPPTNPSLNSKRKKSNQLNLKTCSQQTSCSSSGMEMSPTSDMQAIDSEDSSNAVSHFSHIINSPSRNLDEQQTSTITASESPLMDNTLINVNEVIKKINVDVEKRSKVSQSTQIVVSGTSGPFLSIPEGSAGNVRLLVAAGKNQRMYRVHCPVFHQIKKDSCSNDVKISSNIIGQKISESTILSALTSDNLQVNNTSLGNEILRNTSQSSSVFEHKINKSDIILESMEKAQVLDNNEKQLSYPVLKKSQASQSTFSVIHSIPCKSRQESNGNVEILSETQNDISESVQTIYCDNDDKMLSTKKKINKSNSQVLQQDKILKEDSSLIKPEISNNSSIPFENLEFQPFHSQNKVQEQNKETSSINGKNNQQNIVFTEKLNNTNQISVNSNNEVLNDPLKCDDTVVVKQEKLSSFNSENDSNNMDISNSEHQKEDRKPNLVLNDVAAASAAEIISTANQTSNTHKQNENLKNVKTECESENENENTLSNTVYNMLDNQPSTSMNTEIEPLINCLKNNWSAKNWNDCLSKILPPGTEKLLEGENLKQLQESFQHTTINTFKDLKIFVFEQCKLFDNNVETPKEYDLYDDIDGLGVDKPSTNELFPEVAILNDLDKLVSPTLGLSQASTSKSSDTSALQAKRKSVLSHTTTSTVTTISTEHATHSASKKIKTKVSFLRQALYNEINQDSNDSVSKSFINGSSKSALESIEQQIDLSPGSPSNITAVDSETCMSEDSTSTISSGTPHYNFRKSKRKNIEEDGFIESQVIKRMYRGRASESEEKTEPPKLNSRVQTIAQKQATEKKESNNRRISSRLKNNSVKNNQHTSVKSPQTDSQPLKTTTTRASLRRVSRKTL